MWNWSEKNHKWPYLLPGGQRKETTRKLGWPKIGELFFFFFKVGEGWDLRSAKGKRDWNIGLVSFGVSILTIKTKLLGKKGERERERRAWGMSIREFVTLTIFYNINWWRSIEQLQGAITFFFYVSIWLASYVIIYDSAVWLIDT